MKKLITGFVVAVLVTLSLILLLPHRPPPAFSVGAPLPPGKVQPLLVSAWDTSVLVAPDGSLWGWGQYPFAATNLFGHWEMSVTPKKISRSSDWLSVALSDDHLLALKTDGSLWGLGNNFSGQLGHAISKRHFPSRIGADNNWSQITVGIGYSLALKSDGSLWACGRNEHGQLGDGTQSSRFAMTLIGADRDWKSISAGSFNSFALKKDGTVWSWGLDLTVVPARNDTLSPRQMDLSTNWIAISASDFFLLALKSDGTLWLRGQAYDFSFAEARQAFVQIGEDIDWKEVYPRRDHYFARKRDGTWWGGGNNEQDQLGISIPLAMGTPRSLLMNFDPWSFSTGHTETTLLAKDGNLWTWGRRLGTDRKSVAEKKIKDSLNRIAYAAFHKTPFKIKEPKPIYDRKPYLLWQLPSSVTRSLQKHPSKNAHPPIVDQPNPTNNSPLSLNQ
jgi:hypothetical protein